MHRLKDFFEASGSQHLVRESDQESSDGAMVEEAPIQLRRTVEHQPFIVVPEVSAVGESQSDGIAERAVQAFEDDLRTLKSAFEERVGERLGAAHPVLQSLGIFGAPRVRRRKSRAKWPFGAPGGCRSFGSPGGCRMFVHRLCYEHAR